MMGRVIWGFIVLAALTAVTAAPAGAATGDAAAEIAAIRAEIARLAARLDVLEAGGPAARPAPAAPAAEVPVAARQPERIRFKGDFRYRYEMIDEDGRTERNRNRLRARVGLSGRVNESVTAGVQLATGGDNPTSTNQTLDDGFSTKDLGLDLAYVTWNAPGNVAVTAGKMKNPMHRAGGQALLWDSDLNPEGVALKFRPGAAFVNVAGLYVEERSGADDSFLLGAQAGMDTDLGDGLSLKFGAGYFSYTNTIGNAPFYNGDPLGNTVDAGGNLVNDYREIEFFAELGARLGEVPVQLFADWVRNTEADNFDTAYAIGMTLGERSAPGSWDLGWTYADIEPDAVIGTFNNSDFGGGGTDIKGHIFEGSYAIAPGWTAAFTYFLTEIDESIGALKDYRRLQADLQFKF